MSGADDEAKRAFHFDEGVLSLPQGFRDRSQQVLEWSVDNSSSVVLVIQRDTLAPGPSGSPTDNFDARVAHETNNYPTRFLGFRREPDDYPDPFDGTLPLRRIVFRWKSDRDVLYNHQVFLLSVPLMLIFTVSAKPAHRERADRIMHSALLDLRFRED